MANADEQGWKDFKDIINAIDGAKQSTKSIYGQIGTLKGLKVDIMDDPARKAELKKVIDIYPGYTITSLGTEITKLVTLYTWLKDNGYLNQEAS